MGHDEVDCITRGVALYDTVLAEAGRQQTCRHRGTWGDDPEAEVRDMLPRLLAWLSPEARAYMRDHLAHTSELVSFVHRVGAFNASTQAPH